MFEALGSWWERQKEESRAAKLDRRHPSRAPVARAMRMDARLRREWEESSPVEFPGMRTDGVAWVASCDGLAAFFEACRHSNGPLALPSLAVDSVWHAWIRLDQTGLDRFCLMRVGRSIPHKSKDELESSIEDGISLCWARCCRAEAIDPLSGRLPSIFLLDGELRMPGGWNYRFDREKGRVAHAPISRHSRLDLTSQAQFYPGLTATGLMLSGAVANGEYKAWEKRSKQAWRGGDSGGAGCGLGFQDSSGEWDNPWSASFSSEGSDSDGGSDSGGSSCGGGCGGD